MGMTDLPFDGPAVANPCQLMVLPAWTDYNDHFNVAYYVRAFDEARSVFYRDVLSKSLPAIYPIASKVDYLREIPGGSRLRFTTQILGLPEGCVHLLQTLHSSEPADYLAAIEERIEKPAAPLIDADRVRLLTAMEKHTDLPVPNGWGRLSAVT